MPHRDAPAMCRKIDAALDYIGDDGDDLKPWLMWQIKEIMGGPLRIKMDACNTAELMALLAILVPIFNRGLAGVVVDVVPPGKILTLIRNDDTATGACL